jgi:hypothetical protein
MSPDDWFAVGDRLAQLAWDVDAPDPRPLDRHFTADAVVTARAADGTPHRWDGPDAPGGYARFRRDGVVVADRQSWSFDPVMRVADGFCVARRTEVLLCLIKGVGSNVIRSVAAVEDELVRDGESWLIRRRSVDEQREGLRR